MKFAPLPFFAVAFAFLSIVHVVLSHFGLIALGSAWLAMTTYSSAIAGAAWLDRRVVKAPINFGGACTTR